MEAYEESTIFKILMDPHLHTGHRYPADLDPEDQVEEAARSRFNVVNKHGDVRIDVKWLVKNQLLVQLAML